MAFRRLSLLRVRPEQEAAEHVSFVFPTCAAIDLSFIHYYSINLKSLLLHLRDRHRPQVLLLSLLKVIISDLSKSYSSSVKLFDTT